LAVICDPACACSMLAAEMVFELAGVDLGSTI
jgi:hypothetical protein